MSILGTPGGALWLLLASAFVLWIVRTGTSRCRLVSLPALLRSWLGTWAGRALLLAAWAEAGWHLLCQRP
ncbi:MAG: hypothetical protein ACYCR4_00380 [Acidimicrobiales bacterium]